MSDNVRADARRLLQGITPGPWFVDIVPKGDGRIFVGNRADGREHGLWEIVYEHGDDLGDLKDESARRAVANAEFIAAAPELVDRLLAELDDVTRIAEDRFETMAEYKDDASEALATLKQVRDALLALLDEAWDDGNASGLDGWVGPGRGAGEIDDEAVRSRRRSTERLLSRTFDGGGS
ncbi:hypothetical protein SEA_SUERTE_55 [Gordonia phage Suerte]|uniref:Uncharacterized protein n=1 Tax=Gordonia phage Suerte TaxID=2652883 RepID=A0A5P8DDF2_9CAUD|nr:hypothetical protein PP511_gp55 [Gordonia phage Suerte]QFP97026.1 hypothetical protein SEA_SUERTE_55 [Gordonia phage Suerte]